MVVKFKKRNQYYGVLAILALAIFALIIGVSWIYTILIFGIVTTFSFLRDQDITINATQVKIENKFNPFVNNKTIEWINIHHIEILNASTEINGPMVTSFINIHSRSNNGKSIKHRAEGFFEKKDIDILKMYCEHQNIKFNML